MGFHKLKFHELKRPSLLDSTALLSLAVLVVTHLPAAFEGHWKRQQVAAVLQLAANAQALVDSNLLKMAAFDATRLSMVPKNLGEVAIDATTGVITLTFAEIGGGGKNLKFVPMVKVVKGGELLDLLPLAQAAKAGAVSSGEIFWICTSTLKRSRYPSVMANRGTLDSRYAPADCRN